MYNEVKKTQLGTFGEKLVRNFYSNKGCHIQDTVSTFDNAKDFLVEGKTVEVKTQQAFHVEKAFSVRSNQVGKCKAVDILVFVETPSEKSNCINLWMAINRNFRTKVLRDGREMQLLDKKDMILLESVTNSDLVNEARKLSTSDWKGARESIKYQPNIL